jgi:hypothetical protein
MQIEIQKGRNSEDLERQTMIIGGKERLYVGPLSDCPEDAIIERDLVSCVDVANYMKEAYEAGKRGENFSIEVVDEK